MDKAFWLERWNRSEIGFHEGVANCFLVKYWHRAGAHGGGRVFVPLCGKSADMHWLRQQGFAVTGVEVSRIAVEAFYQEQGYAQCTPVSSGALTRFESGGVEIYCGDFFSLKREDIKEVDSVYDRASMVALPPEMRTSYAHHLLSILPSGTRILLIAIDYPQEQMCGPPFALPHQEILRLFGDRAAIELLEDIDTLKDNPRFASRGVTRLHEKVYLLTLG